MFSGVVFSSTAEQPAITGRVRQPALVSKPVAASRVSAVSAFQFDAKKL